MTEAKVLVDACLDVSSLYLQKPRVVVVYGLRQGPSSVGGLDLCTHHDQTDGAEGRTKALTFSILLSEGVSVLGVSGEQLPARRHARLLAPGMPGVPLRIYACTATPRAPCACAQVHRAERFAFEMGSLERPWSFTPACIIA